VVALQIYPFVMTVAKGLFAVIAGIKEVIVD
jgi:hypothetical protein